VPERLEHIVLGLEIEIERALRDSGGPDDLVNTRGFETLEEKQRLGGVDELLAVDFGVLGTGTSGGGCRSHRAG
jgi:hypothetical protein